MSKQQCEICGQMKSPQEMSKSYKHRCKECVARLTRINRQAAKERTENISGQLEVTGYTLRHVDDVRTERVKIATAMMQVLVSRNGGFYQEYEASTLAQEAVGYADALLAEIDKK